MFMSEVASTVLVAMGLVFGMYQCMRNRKKKNGLSGAYLFLTIMTFLCSSIVLYYNWRITQFSAIVLVTLMFTLILMFGLKLVESIVNLLYK